MPSRRSALQVALVATGIAFISLQVLFWVWPSGFRWTPVQRHDEQMIVGIYATLGVFVILAARDPAQHKSLIAFTIWSSVVHATIMLVQSFTAPEHHGHLVGDVPALYLVAAVLGWLSRDLHVTRASVGRRPAPVG